MLVSRIESKDDKTLYKPIILLQINWFIVEQPLIFMRRTKSKKKKRTLPLYPDRTYIPNYKHSNLDQTNVAFYTKNYVSFLFLDSIKRSNVTVLVYFQINYTW